jgi:cobalt-zinc-cadmium efflux system protein
MASSPGQYSISRRSHEREQMSLKISIVVTIGIMFLEVVGGILSNSLALISDAWHMFTDVSALVLCFLAGELSLRPPDSNRTFGYHRVEILSALVNGTTLVIVAFYIFYEAIGRFFSPAAVKGFEMLVITVIGLAANLFSMLVISRSMMRINVKSAFLHIANDTLSSVGVLLAAIIILFTGWYPIDPIMSIAVGLLVIRSTITMLSEVLQILLEGVPSKINLSEVVGTIKGIPGIHDVHDVHIWSITSYVHVLSAHIVIGKDSLDSIEKILNDTKLMINEKYGISHTTLQVEPEAYEEIGEVHK